MAVIAFSICASWNALAEAQQAGHWDERCRDFSPAFTEVWGLAASLNLPADEQDVQRPQHLCRGLPQRNGPLRRSGS